MRDHRASHWFVVGLTGTLFALLMLALAAPVAADGSTLVTTLPGQDPNAPIQVVSSPGFINTGTAVNPADVIVNNGGAFCTATACYPAGTVCTVNGCTVPFFNGGCTINGCVVPNCVVNGVNFCAAPFCTVYGCNTLGYTAAGPIVAIDANGHTIVYDVRGGTYDTYTQGPNGKYCETDGGNTCP